MFPRLRQTLSTAFVDRVDDLVEFSTLGEYVLAEDLLPIAATATPACRHPRAHVARDVASGRVGRDSCAVPDWAWPSSCGR